MVSARFLSELAFQLGLIDRTGKVPAKRKEKFACPVSSFLLFLGLVPAFENRCRIRITDG
jgi:hypothetical protein